MLNATPPKWELNDALALSALNTLPGPYVPWTAWSMRPAAVVSLVNLVLLERLQSVVELGAGASSVFLARALKQTGGRLVTIDEDARWAEQWSQRMANEGLDQVAVHHVAIDSLEPPSAVDDWPTDAPTAWYDSGVLAELVPEEIDLLVVDGPSAGAEANELVRLPAIPFFAESIRGGTVVIDDADRGAEARIARLWGGWLGRDPVVYKRSAIAVISDGHTIFPAF